MACIKNVCLQTVDELLIISWHPATHSFTSYAGPDSREVCTCHLPRQVAISPTLRPLSDKDQAVLHSWQPDPRIT